MAMDRTTGRAYDCQAMKSNVLSQALVGHGGCKESDGLLKVADASVSIFVVLGDNMLNVERVEWVKMEAESVVIQTRTDRYVFAPEDIRGVRVVKKSTDLGYAQ